MFKQFANGWVCKNSQNYLAANNCFKIITCDPLDDTIDQFVSTMAGVGELSAKDNYRTDDFEKFYESLVYICNMEDIQYKSQEWSEKDEYN